MRSDRATRMMAIAACVAAAGMAGAQAPQSKKPVTPATEPPLEILWRVELTARDITGVAAANPFVIVTTPRETFAYAPEDGRLLWTKDLGSAVPPVVMGQSVAIISSSAVHVLFSDGTPRWQANIPGVLSAIAAGSDLILVTGKSVTRWSNGQQTWHLPLDADPITPVVMNGDMAFIGVKPAAVAAIDAAKGRHLWSEALPELPDSLGTAPERLMVCTSQGNSAGVLSSYRTSGGHDLDWPYPLIRCIGSPLSDTRRTYVAFMDNTVRAFDTGSGHQRWTGRLPTRPLAGPIRFPNSIVVPMSTGTLAEFTIEGKPVAAAKASEKLPNLLRMLGAVASPDRKRVFTTGTSSEVAGGLLFAWARAK